MTRKELFSIYSEIMDELSRHTIDTAHNPNSNRKTTFYFVDCCGGDIVDNVFLKINKKY